MALSHTSSIGDRQNPIAILESETEDDSSDDGDLSERKVSSLDATFTDAIYQELQDLYLKAQESQSIAAGRKGQLSSKALIHQLLSCDEQVIQEVLKIIAAAARERKVLCAFQAFLRAKSHSQRPPLCYSRYTGL